MTQPISTARKSPCRSELRPRPTFIPAAGVGGPVYADEPTLPGRFPDDSSFFEMAPLDPPPIEIFSNLGENEVRLDKGTDILASDGHKVGEAESFTLGDMGLVEQVAVSEGFLGAQACLLPTQGHRRVRRQQGSPEPEQGSRRSGIAG